MSILNDLLDTPIDATVSADGPPIPDGKASATLVAFGDVRPIVSSKDGQEYHIVPAMFEVTGQSYNELVNREVIKVRHDVMVAIDENGKIDQGKRDNGMDKNASMARFFKAFGRDVKGSKWNDLLGGEVTVSLTADKDYQTGEPTGFIRIKSISRKAA